MKFEIGDVIKKIYRDYSWVIFKVISLDETDFCGGRILLNNGTEDDYEGVFRIINSNCIIEKLTKEQLFVEVI